MHATSREAKLLKESEAEEADRRHTNDCVRAENEALEDLLSSLDGRMQSAIFRDGLRLDATLKQ